MIYTLTLAPAVDLYVTTHDFVIGGINHPESQRALPGGKGINVSIMLKNLGRESTCLGFTGGLTGDYIKRELDALKIKHDFVSTASPCRVNIKIDGAIKETAFNSLPPLYSEKERFKLCDKLLTLKKGDILIISGAFGAKNYSIKYAQDLFEKLTKQGVKLVVDTTKSSLLRLLKFKPILVKPNKEELEELFYTKLNTDNDVVECAKKLVNSGAQNVVVSLGAGGAILVNKDTVIKTKAPTGKVIKTVGSGDSLVAGFIDEYIRSKNVTFALKKGVYAGSASAFSSGLATRKEVEALLKKWK